MRAPVRWGITAAVFLASLVCAGPGCGSESAGGGPDPSTDAGPEASDEGESTSLALEDGGRVVYSLAWSWEGARWDEALSAYVFETDLGYTVGIEAGHVATLAVTLVPCEAEASLGRGVWGGARAFFAPRSARADHAYDYDASLVEAPVIESMFSEASREIGVGTSEGARYCAVHHLAAPLAKLGDDGFWMEGWSAHVRGFYQVSPDAERVPFEDVVNLSSGALRELSAARPAIAAATIRDASGGAAAARVVLRRSPARAFDGVVFEELGEGEIAWEMLRGIETTATAIVERSPAE